MITGVMTASGVLASVLCLIRRTGDSDDGRKGGPDCGDHGGPVEAVRDDLYEAVTMQLAARDSVALLCLESATPE